MRIGISACALSLLTGVCTMQCFTILPDARWLWLLPVCVLYIITASGWFRYLVIGLVGLLWAMMHAHDYFNSILPEPIAGNDLWVEGIITDIPDITEQSSRFNLRLTQSSFSDDAQPEIIRLSWYREKIALKAGEKWRLLVRLKPPHGLMNPGGFDYERWLYQQGIHATGYVRRHSDNHKLADASSLDINKYRQIILDRLTNSSNREFNDLIAALTIGYKSDISSQHWRLLTLTGTSHLMAISGLHIGLVAGMVFWGIRRLNLSIITHHPSDLQLAAMVSLLFAIIYALLAGFAIPTQRALIMLTVVMLGLLFKRQVRPVTGLSLALIIILVLDPVSVLSVGFWFSFMAVAVISYSFSGRLKPLNIWQQWGRLQWVLALALFPLSLYIFQQGSIISPLANFVLVPWVSILVVPLVLMAGIMVFLYEPLAGLIFDLADASLGLIWPFIQMLSELQFASWYSAQHKWLVLILSLSGMLLILAPRGIPFRFLGLFMLLPLISYEEEKLKQAEFTASLLDVGQGLSLFIQTSNHSLLFDTGPKFSESFDTGRMVVLPFLKARGIHQLDKMIVSHGDNDHIGGAQSILEAIKVDHLTGQDLNSLRHDNKSLCQQGDAWQWDGINFQILHPDSSGLYQKRNNYACVLRISSSYGSLLVTSDIEKRAEQRILRDHAGQLKSDVMIIPHHGSKTSSTEPFIEAVSPHYALVSSGYRNRFGHPKKIILSRYRARNITLLNTTDMGAIDILFNQQQGVAKPVSYRAMSGNYWNHH
ncbi:MAG: DNA internalization-related competence protein ComEC/Rec2 [Gammaproteobacteria bacterium]|nr:DNA internalization-related competence protein ComEC/Rec2 [Gammaproteobacteria bacterium]MCW9003998.1 DNA internalization-related competence protein ComEC/Rec2 [Gammaproteobacteria bacterium]MCW9055706.1 DNA internalization-related competence protein ComEC/Rec2 [Gammaproteobacteria bacterium]